MPRGVHSQILHAETSVQDSGVLFMAPSNVSNSRSRTMRLGQELSRMRIDSSSSAPSTEPGVSGHESQRTEHYHQKNASPDRQRIETFYRSLFRKSVDQKPHTGDRHVFDREDSSNTELTSSFGESLDSTCEDFETRGSGSFTHGACHGHANQLISRPSQNHFEDDSFPVIEWETGDEDLHLEKTGLRQSGSSQSSTGRGQQIFKQSFVPVFFQEKSTVSAVAYASLKKRNLPFESLPVRSLKRSKSINSRLCSLGGSASLHPRKLLRF